MKLAEALSKRKDLQDRISQLQGRICNNVKVQDGEQPLEDPAELMKTLESCLSQLEELIARINATNMNTVVGKRTLTEMMAEREVLGKRINTLRAIFNKATESEDRYSRSEIKKVTIIDVKALSKKIDSLSQKMRKLDIEIQTANFTTELI